MNEVGNSGREDCPASRNMAPLVAGLVSIVDWRTYGLDAAGTR